MLSSTCSSCVHGWCLIEARLLAPGLRVFQYVVGEGHQDTMHLQERGFVAKLYRERLPIGSMWLCLDASARA